MVMATNGNTAEPNQARKKPFPTEEEKAKVVRECERKQAATKRWARVTEYAVAWMVGCVMIICCSVTTAAAAASLWAVAWVFTKLINI